MTASTLAVVAALVLAPGLALAQQRPAPRAAVAPQADVKASPLAGLGSNSKEPIKIDADRLDVFDKDKKAVFAGNVLAVQGETTMRCSSLTVFYEQSATAKGGTPPGRAPAGPAAPGAENGISKLDCKGPVTVVSKDQIATGDHAVYDKVANKVFLTGNAKISQGPNVTTGERVVYDLATSQATVETKPGARVRALLIPGSGDLPEAGAKKNDKGAAKTN